MLICGDCRQDLAPHGPFDMLIADPPYGDTSLDWDRHVDGWIAAAYRMLKPNGSLWVFGSMRFFLTFGLDAFSAAGFRYAQDIVWEKHNGSSFHADRFKRVHEHVVQFYRDCDAWGDVYNQVQSTPDARPKQVRRKTRPPHTGEIGSHTFVSVDGGPRIMRSVIEVPSCHGRAIHRTEKPVSLLEILIRTSCRPGGVVGDLFAGSGAAGEAASVLSRGYVGTESDPARAAAAFARLERVLPFGGEAVA